MRKIKNVLSITLAILGWRIIFKLTLLLIKLHAQGRLKVSNRVTRICEIIGKSFEFKQTAILE